MRSAKAYNSAVRLLGRREHSVAELRRKLRQKHGELGRDAIESLLESLQQDRLLSDQRFTEVLVRARIAKGYGPTYIKQELASKGIDSELAECALEDAAAWQKAARFLMRRGFSSSVAMKALGERPY